MANYTCKEIPLCTNFQSAICLHCNRPLCLFHISEHGKILFNDLENLSNEAKAAFDCINEDSEKNTITYRNVLASLNEWRTEQIEKIEQIYQDQLQCVVSQQQTLELLRHELLRKLEDDALQQLRLIQSQQSASMGVVNLIQQTIKQVREDSQHLNCLFPTPPTINIDQSPSNTTPILTQQSTAGKINISTSIYIFVSYYR
jgi:iron-sulfur cluster repair protein YtfE (RIC family)